MQIPFPVVGSEIDFKIDGDAILADLMDMTEEDFINKATQADQDLELQINVLWNVKDFKKALNPNDKVSQHFVEGESFGVYGDVMPAQKPPLKEEDKTPVVILTGFLGSGKTTLLNYMLTEQQEKKIAVIENEFGEISIDDALLTQDKLAMAEEVLVMDNGCMCCTIRGDLTNGLKQILDKMHKGSRIDCIAIETTGMADPVPIVRTFMSDPVLTEELRLDGVVTVADAKHLPGRLDDDIEEGKVNEAYQQIAFADKIILNKLDLVTSEEAISVKDRIRDINKFAKVLPAVKSRVKLSELTNMRAHDMCHFADLELDKEEVVEHGHIADVMDHGGHGGHESHGGHDENCAEDHGHEGHGGYDRGHGADGHGTALGTAHGGAHGHGHDASRHDTRVNSFAIVRQGEILPRKLSAWMQSLGNLPKEWGTIFRIKAILAVKGHPFKHVFHAVMDVSEEDDAARWEEGEKKISKIVFIGKGLDQAALRKGFEEIFEDEKDAKDAKS